MAEEAKPNSAASLLFGRRTAEKPEGEKLEEEKINDSKDEKPLDEGHVEQAVGMARVDFNESELTMGVSPAEVGVTYISHPIMRFMIGPYEFVDGRLNLVDETEIAKFEKLLGSLPPMERRKVQKIDVEAANKLVATHIQSRVVKGMDSTEGSIGPSATQIA